MRKLDISNSLGVSVFLAAKSQERLAELEMKKQLGLTPSQWKIILALSLTDGLTQKELADKIYVDGSTLVPILDKMEQNGLIERKADTNDRRINRIFLTPKSESTVDSIILIVLQLRKMMYKGVSEEEMNSARKVLDAITKNSDELISNSKSPEQIAP
jgi:MarR family transcriptional regulator for hemolysin